MSEMPVVTATAVAPKPSDIAPTQPPVEPKPEPVEGEDALGDAGKKALDAMKAERNKYRDEAKTAAEERDRAKAEAEGRLAEYEAEKNAREAGDKRFHERLFSAELKAAGAVEGVKHPEMLDRLIDPKDFPLDAEGNLDAGAITEAVKAAITKYDLATAATARFQGSPDAGPRNAESQQYTREQLARMSPAEIMQAKEKGLLNDVLGIKTSA